MFSTAPSRHIKNMLGFSLVACAVGLLDSLLDRRQVTGVSFQSRAVCLSGCFILLPVEIPPPSQMWPESSWRGLM